MRIRTIKPEFWSHPIMARLPDEVQLLALALLAHADDEGYFLADAAIVRGACMPFRESLATISRSLAKLSEVGWIEVAKHEIQGDVGHIVNWEKHQKVDHARQSKIKTYFSRENLANVSRDSRENVAPEQGTGNREQGTGKRGAKVSREASKPTTALVAISDIPPDLEKFHADIEAWLTYRLKIKKPIKSLSAEAFWKSLRNFGDDLPASINQSIANSYQGLFPPKQGFAKKPAQDRDEREINLPITKVSLEKAIWMEGGNDDSGNDGAETIDLERDNRDVLDAYYNEPDVGVDGDVGEAGGDVSGDPREDVGNQEP